MVRKRMSDSSLRGTYPPPAAGAPERRGDQPAGRPEYLRDPSPGDPATEWLSWAQDEEATVWMDEAAREEAEGWILAPGRAREDPIRLTHFPFVIGKMEGEVDYVLDQSTVSRIHARIERDEEGLWITDCRSTNGTWHNGRRLPPEQRIRLEEEDEIALADVSFRLERKG